MTDIMVDAESVETLLYAVALGEGLDAPEPGREAVEAACREVERRLKATGNRTVYQVAEGMRARASGAEGGAVQTTTEERLAVARAIAGDGYAVVSAKRLAQFETVTRSAVAYTGAGSRPSLPVRLALWDAVAALTRADVEDDDA